ncbi:glycosyltransferase family 2 protein [Nitrospirillum viridazoti]|uniref:Glycosyl transferase family 2 n=2 Tax=Nitrospirillum TaxID=1543705 RepID=A0A248K1N6_9PROT|nr:glycosyltransferase family 2 protein [Nitrospirillum amazonense]ASG24907.1 glycosyl transferase family 2 [Nitrospirillum amazonense CBAmc]EGY01468.1 glycosyl transferase family protein [Nitrospirillum amazonense Y2]TWB35495.1 glycosyl transferase family 2 [Nitrospirillum amazonense]TWB63828.1 glycosyl transferase family 2 [Nitrospirillum amazonense]
MAAQPDVTVIIPTHKRAHLLRRALESVKQQPAVVEVIVISDATDGETDRACAAWLSADDIYIRRNGAPGPSASRNLGLSLARGRYVLFLDDDDAWHANFIPALLAQPAVQQGLAVYANSSVVTERRGPDGPEFLDEGFMDVAGRLTLEIYIKNQVHMSCFAFPRTLLAGLEFDVFMRAYEDWDFMLAVINRQMPVHVPVLASRIFEVKDATTDRRGDSRAANDYNVVIDYLYVYRRHPAPNADIAQRRVSLMNGLGIPATPSML